MILFIWIQKQAKLFYGFSVGKAVIRVEAVVEKENRRSTFFALGAVLSLWNCTEPYVFLQIKCSSIKLFSKRLLPKKKNKPQTEQK